MTGTLSVTNGKLSERARIKLLECFEQDDLRMLVSDNFEVKLEWVTPATRKYETVVFELIEWATTEGTLLQLLTAAARRNKRPDLAALRDECANADPAMQVDPIAACAVAFRRRVDLFQYLNAYKVLHDTLHKLDSDLPVIATEAEDWSSGRVTVSEATARKLRKYAAEAIKSAKRTDRPEELGELMSELSAAMERFLTHEELVHRRRAFADIEAFPAWRLGELNSDLVRCAKALKLTELLTMTDGASRAAPGELSTLLNDFSTPAERLTGLIRVHNLCQRIDLQLRQAETEGTRTVVEVPFWSSIRRWLDEILNHRRNDDLLATVHREAVAFERRDGGLDEFALRFAQFFLSIDETLREVSRDLLDAVLPLLNRPEFNR